MEISDSDVPGLRIRVGTSGTKTFILRKRTGGKIKNITVGRYGPRFGLAEARRKARTLVSDLEAGKMPLEPQRRSHRTAGTIRALLPAYLASKEHLRSHGEVRRILERYVLPVLGDRFADSVTRGEVTSLIDAIAARAPVQARAVHAQLSAFYTWALPRLDRLPSNPCRDAGRPVKPAARGRVLTEEELRALWQCAEETGGTWGAALRLLLLTGARRSEVFEADQAEFNLAEKIWEVPANRAKNGVPHIIPLSEPAVALLKRIPNVEGSTKLFPARGNLENGSSGISKLQRRLRTSVDEKLGREEGERWTLHDLRRTVATGLQRLGTRFEVTEALLNHVSGAKSGVAGVYQRHDWKTEKRAALLAWARELDRIVTGKR
jgi:integrase